MSIKNRSLRPYSALAKVELNLLSSLVLWLSFSYIYVDTCAIVYKISDYNCKWRDQIYNQIKTRSCCPLSYDRQLALKRK